ncbi:MAG: glycosyltransferase family 2 protein [Leptospiraceae bacterium]|nr:glycosyltransferase family 2 protein [Leptospiraceae bacterium]
MGRASIIIPFKDAASTIKECLQSIQEQTEPDFEALLIDDGSSDKGPGLVSEVAQQDGRIRLLANPGKGLVSALNFGLQQAVGQALFRMDADDIMHARRLEMQLEHLRRVEISSCRVELMGSPGAGMEEYIRWQNALLSEEQIRSHRYVECPVLHPTIAFRASLLESQTNLYAQGPYPEDYELVLRWISQDCSIQKLEESLLFYRCHDKQLSRIDDRYSRRAFHDLRRRYLRKDSWLQGRLKDRAPVVWGASRQSRRRFEDHFPGLRPEYFVDIKPSLLGAIRGSATGAHSRPGGCGVPRESSDAKRAQKQRALPAIKSPEQLFEDPARPFVLVYVNSRGARPIIEAALEEHGYRAGESYLCIG